MIRTELPPTITATLPDASAAPTLPNATTTPSGLIVPGSATTQTTTPSGLIVVRNELSQVSKGSELVLSDKPLDGDGAVEAVKAAYAELAARSGDEAARIVYGDTLEMVQGIRSDELRHQAIEALLAGDLSRAAELISQAG
ncbi:MAG: hypothetical protein KDC46_04940 [Thermoleophilia bacterium]|nr:hypothetical protein [Thermoleophilia bacterium]